MPGDSNRSAWLSPDVATIVKHEASRAAYAAVNWTAVDVDSLTASHSELILHSKWARKPIGIPILEMEGASRAAFNTNEGIIFDH